MSENSCLFCRIVSGDLPGELVHQDERCVVLRDLNPQAPMHVLVVPRRHIATLGELSAEDDGLVGELVRRGAALAKAAGEITHRFESTRQLRLTKLDETSEFPNKVRGSFRSP